MAPLGDPLVELLRRTADGDEAAFACLYDATIRRALGLSRRILEEESAAEDATLNAYAYIWSHASRFDPGRGSPITWILTVVRSKAIDLLRCRVRLRGREQPLDAVAAFEDPGPGPETVCAQAERGERVREALASLPREQRQAIEISYFGGLSHSEAAAALGQPLGTVKSRIRMGLSSLRRYLVEA